ncbi:N-acetylmuramic acid 6-phosphate etherase [Brevibacillus choshinensis]|uniref:N-acetylmuramic acid 6-phosphate etherase n=1 Tax=Brevibacillus choshinensis TaxID=54911 RepID=A0ABR5NAD7_BRECH|nr:N-acetylmuramic acid 6-phosphate etherase [Brevibacillus choshinensis]KQL48500.1 N-acetylmuramic acid 6-phosphate etherase [Brevibacillus choshinensis]
MKLENLQALTTEGKNESTQDLDRLSTRGIVQLMNDEDKKVPYAVERVLDQVSEAVELIVAALEKDGRLFYFGAGTSGRLGILDASECPPTFGTNPELVQGVIAGGPSAMIRAVEGAEDSVELGIEDVHKYGVTDRDVVVGIAASGRTPYVLGVLQEAQAIGARTISVSCNQPSFINKGVDVAINVVVGPEVLTGSTRLKAGSAQKLVLNMLTTATMIKLGKVYGNLMVNVQATNLKLKERVKRIVMEVTGVSYAEAERLADQAKGDAKTAILMKLTNTSREEAAQLLNLTNGRIREAIQKYS